jgi:heptosyltransferase I
MRQLPVTKNQLASLAGIERLLIVRLGSMGDIIHTLPAVIALRQAFPNALIGWVIEERWAELLCTLPTPRSGARSPQRPLVDRIHTVDTAKWRKSFLSLQTLQEIASALSDLRAPRYQIAVDFQGAVRSALIARWSGATTIYGAAQPRENVASMFYTRTVMARGDHIIEQNMSLAWAVTGSALEIPALEFPHDEVAKQDCDRRRQEQRLYKFVIMNPGAGWGAKRWPEQRYGEVARELAKDGIKILVNYGPGEEALARAVEEASGGVAKAIACSLTQLIALTRRAALFIGGDTGPMHLAAALGVPAVAIFGPTNPVRNGPFGTKSIVLRSSSSITSHVRRHEPEEGLLEINSVAVVAAARQLLGDCRG